MIPIEIPSVLPNAVEIPEGLGDLAVAAIRRHFRDPHAVDIQSGPLLCGGGVDLFSHYDEVPTHVDGAGYCYGLVITTEPGRELVVGDRRFPLAAGTAYLIDTDLDHSAPGEGMLVFLTHDLHHEPASELKKNPPDTDLRDYAQRALQSLTDLLLATTADKS